MLINAGAQVTGYALNPPTNPNLFTLCGLERDMNSVIGDIRDIESLEKAFLNAKPEIVFHLAAMPIVRDSYLYPRYTYETNVMGTVNLLECIRKYNYTRSVLNITTDKVYQNNEWSWGYRENDCLDGYDPYSNSKSCSEMITHCYKRAFLKDMAVSTARAGNVLGGGDFSKDRIIPDCIRAIENEKDIVVRNPNSIRPYQHVLDPLYAYLMIAQMQHSDMKYAGNYNIGPDENDNITTGRLVELFCSKWKAVTGNEMVWTIQSDGGPHEANFLRLDCSKLKYVFGWKPRWGIEKTIEKTVEWTKSYLEGEDSAIVMDKQINEFIKEELIIKS